MNFTIDKLNETELNTIVNGLAQMPYAQVYQLIDKIKTQVAKQAGQEKVTAE